MSGASAVKISTNQSLNEEQFQKELTQMSKEILSALSMVDPVRGRELLNDFVSELLLAAAEQRQRDERRKKQSERIAAAKANGVRFGRPAMPLPDNFDDIHKAWREGQLTLGQAAERCGMPTATFYDKALRRERAASLNK